MAEENRDWGYRRIQGALSNLRCELARSTLAEILERHGIESAQERSQKTFLEGVSDATRLGVTGLWGRDWQTITLSSLDPRVAVAVEVAGFGSLQSNITNPRDTDDLEQEGVDFCAGQDYTHLVALCAPRPTLLIHNAADNCRFRSALVKPYIFDALRPMFGLFGHETEFAWYENRDPGTHNYELDNRQHAYQFFNQHFGHSLCGRHFQGR